MDPNEVVYNQYSIDSGKPVYRGDGAQRSYYDGSYPYASIDVNTIFDNGGLIKFEDQTNYTYSSADATKAYSTL